MGAKSKHASKVLWKAQFYVIGKEQIKEKKT